MNWLSLIGILSAFIVGTGSTWWTQREITKRNLKERVFVQKVKGYAALVDAIFEYYYPIERRSAWKPYALAELRFLKTILMWANASLIRAHEGLVSIQRTLADQSTRTKITPSEKIHQDAQDRLLWEMREDLGLSNDGLSKGDLILLVRNVGAKNRNQRVVEEPNPRVNVPGPAAPPELY